MITIDKLKIFGFGSFQEKELHLAPGLNVIFGGNEAGKSTIHCFIEAMLFGFWQPYSFQRDLAPGYEKYRPWSGSSYGGQLDYTWSGGKVRVERDFSNHTVSLYDLEAEKSLENIALNSWGEPDFARLHFGCNKLVFRNTISISQLGSATDAAVAQEVRNLLSNLAQSGGSGISVNLGIEILRESLQRLAKEMEENQEQLIEIGNRLEAAKRQMQETIQIEMDQHENSAKLEELNLQRKHLRELAAKIKGQAALVKLKRLENLRTGVQQTRAELENLGQGVIQRTDYQDWQKIETAMNQVSESHKIHTLALDNIIGERRQQEEILQELAPYADYNQDTLIEMSSAWQVQAKSQQVIEEMEGEWATLGEELRDVTAQLSRLPYFRPDALEQAAALNSIAMGTGSQGPQEATIAEMERYKSRINSGKALRWMLLLALPAAAASAWLEPLLAFATLPLLGGIIAVSRSIKKASAQSRNLRREIYTLELEQVNDLRQREHARKELEAFLNRIGVADLDEMEEKFNSFLFYSDKNYHLLREQKFLRGKLEDYYRESEAKGEELTSILNKVGLVELPIDQALASFRENLDKLLAAKSNLSQIQAQEAEATKRLEQASFELAAAKEESARLLQSFALDSPEEVETSFEKGQRRHDLEQELAALEQRIKDILGEEAEEVLRQQAEGIDPAEEPVSSEDLTGRIEKVEEEYIQQQTKTSEGQGRLESFYASLPPLAELEEEYWLLKENLREKSIEQQGVKLAIATITQIAEEQKNQIAPGLNEMVSALMSRITGGKYNNLQVDKDMAIQVSSQDSQGDVDLERLSGGTIDQVYFAARVAIADLVSGGGLPLFLDDSFVQYDDSRLKNMLGILLELANQRQIILLTCQQRELTELARLGEGMYRLVGLEN